jgi:hypothetical protein
VTTSGVKELSAELDGSLLERPDFTPFNSLVTLRPAATVAAVSA